MKQKTKLIISILVLVLVVIAFSFLVVKDKELKELEDQENTDIEENENNNEINNNEIEDENENILDDYKVENQENNNENGSDEMNTIVVMETSKGNIEIELYDKQAPITVRNFLDYVDSEFYEGLVFHRVIAGFMVQGGGFAPDGTQKTGGASIKLESDVGLSNLTGTIAMARTSDPDSATNQFFINTVDNAGLDRSSYDPGYAVFGKVISGMEVVKEIEKVETGLKGYHDDWPEEDIVILKVYRK